MNNIQEKSSSSIINPQHGTLIHPANSQTAAAAAAGFMSRFGNGTHQEFLKSQSSTPRVLHQQQPGSSSSCYNMEDHPVMCNPTRNNSHPAPGGAGAGGTNINILRDRSGSKFLDFRRINSTPSLVSCNSTFHQQLSATDSSNLHERLRNMSSHGDQEMSAGMLMLHQLQSPKVPSLSPTSYSHSTSQFEPHDHPASHGPLDDGSSAGNAIKPPDHQPATMVPAAFNPVFWLLQGASASSSDHHNSHQADGHQLHHHHSHPPGASSHQPAVADLPEIMLQHQSHDQPQQLCHSANLENQQQQLPEIEMRLGPFAPPSSTSHHHFHAEGASGGFGSSVDTRGDLCSITANFHKGAPHEFPHDPNLDDVHGHLMSHLQGGIRGQPYNHHVSWDDTSTRASSSTSNNSTDNVSHTAGSNQMQFNESTLHWAGFNGTKPSANSSNHADDQMVRSSSTIDMISAGTSTDHPPCSNTSTAQLSPDHQHDHQLSGGDLAVMKWCNLVSSQEASTRGGAQVHHQVHENELHHPVKVLMLADQTLLMNSRSPHHPVPQTPMTWQIQHQGGQDMYYPSEGPVASMSPELQRMAAVLDQI